MSNQLLEHKNIVESNQNLLSILGDYWTDYHDDYDFLKQFIGAVEALYAQQFQNILREVSNSNIVDVQYQKILGNSVLVFDSQKAVYTYDQDGGFQFLDYQISFFNTYNTITTIQRINSNLFNSELSLDVGTDFEVIGTEVIRFHRDIFSDQDILRHVFHHTDNAQTYILLWAENSAVKSYDINSRYGIYSYPFLDKDSKEYKSVVAALQYFFVNQKSVPNIQNSLNILAGIPFSRTPGETVTRVRIINAQGEDANPELLEINEEFAETQEEVLSGNLYYEVTTDKNTYTINYGTSLLVAEGETLSPYQLLATMYHVKDYKTHPDWYKNVRFPENLLVGIDDSFFETEELKNSYIQRGRNTYDGSFRFDGSVKAGSYYSRLKAVSADNGGDQLEVMLYDLIDNVLKYNLVNMKGRSSYVTYEHFKLYFTKLYNIFEIIKPGFPVYLHTIFDFIVRALFGDIVNPPSEQNLITILYNITDREGGNNNLGLGSCLRYDAEITHEIFWKVFHDTKHLFNAENTYNEFDAYYYSCPSKQSIFTLGLVKVFFEEHAKVEGVPDGTYIDVFYNCGLRYDGLGHYGATLHANQLKIDANIEDCANGWVPAPPEPPEEVIVQSLNYDGLGHHNYTLRYGFFDPNWLYYSRLPLPDLDTLKHNAETVYAGVEDYLPFREVPYTVYDIDPFEEDTAQAGDSLADSLDDSLADSLPTTGNDSLGDSSSPTTPGQSPESPTYIQFYHDGVTQYNSRTKYGTSDSSWNDFGIGPQIDKVSLVVDDFFSINVRDERNHYTDIASVPSDQEGTFIDKFSYQFEDTGLPYYHKHDGTTTYNAEPAVLFDGTNQYNKNTFYYQFTGNLYNSYPIKDTFQFKVTKKQIDDSAAIALDDSGGTIRTLRHQDSGGFVVFTDTSPHEWSGDFSPNIEIELNAEF